MWDKAKRIKELERKVEELTEALNELTKLAADRFDVVSINPQPIVRHQLLHGSGVIAEYLAGHTLRRLHMETKAVYVPKATEGGRE